MENFEVKKIELSFEEYLKLLKENKIIATELMIDEKNKKISGKILIYSKDDIEKELNNDIDRILDIGL